MSVNASFNFGDRSIVIEDGVLFTFYGRDVTDAVELSPVQAVNLASALLQYATQKGVEK